VFLEQKKPDIQVFAVVASIHLARGLRRYAARYPKFKGARALSFVEWASVDAAGTPDTYEQEKGPVENPTLPICGRAASRCRAKASEVPLVVALCAGALAYAILPARAVDHDNIDANRPLDFDDAETISFGERSLDVGAALANRVVAGWRRGRSGLLYGFARNWHLNVGIDPSLLGQNRSGRRFSAGDLSLGVQHNFNRETTSSPAFGFRADASSDGTRFARH
jgi:hypothetical protein